MKKKHEIKGGERKCGNCAHCKKGRQGYFRYCTAANNYHVIEPHFKCSNGKFTPNENW